jgi:hypothetical protein
LGVPAAQLGRGRGFVDYGLDSLTSIELRNLLEVSLEAKLPQTIAFTYPTIEALSDYLIRNVLKSESDACAEGPTDGNSAGDFQSSLADEISEMSASEAEDELLRELERFDQMNESVKPLVSRELFPE